MKAVIVSYRRGRSVQKMNEALLKTDNIDSAAAAHKVLGKKVIFQVSKNKKMEGKVVAVHGGKGIVRVRFSKGIPGQAIGMECEIKA